MTVDIPDTSLRFWLAAGRPQETNGREEALSILRSSWPDFSTRHLAIEEDWVNELAHYLDNLVEMRIDHVREWLTQNLSRFQTSHASIEELRRIFDVAIVDLRSNVQLCKMQCASCHLQCIRGRLHEGSHDCQTTHRCLHECDFCVDEQKSCTMA